MPSSHTQACEDHRCDHHAATGGDTDCICPPVGWVCPICKRWEDGTGPCAHTRPPKDNAELSWLRDDLKKAGEQLRRYEAGL